jgi:hypothetical protein
MSATVKGAARGSNTNCTMPAGVEVLYKHRQYNTNWSQGCCSKTSQPPAGVEVYYKYHVYNASRRHGSCESTSATSWKQGVILTPAELCHLISRCYINTPCTMPAGVTLAVTRMSASRQLELRWYTPVLYSYARLTTHSQNLCNRHIDLSKSCNSA